MGQQQIEEVLKFQWGPAVQGERSYLALPVKVIGLMRKAGLTESEMLLIIAINSHRLVFNKDELPYPSDSKLAELTGLNRSSINRMAKRLETKGMLKVPVRGKQGRGHTNHYDLSPLFEKLAEVQEQVPVPERKKRQVAKSEAPKQNPAQDTPHSEYEAIQKRWQEIEDMLPRVTDSDEEMRLLREQMDLEQRARKFEVLHEPI